MGSVDAQERPVLNENASSDDVGGGSNNFDSLEVLSGRQTTNELESAAENLSRVELDLACCAEKLVNLDILVIHVASRENDFEAFSLEEEPSEGTHVVKALEFDFLYAFLDCEIHELESFLSALHAEIASSSEVVSSLKHLGDSVKELEEKIHDCEDSLKRSFKQALDIKEQCSYFKKILHASTGSEEGKDDREPSGLENGDLPSSSAKIKMQTAEEQRNILRMLEKSLAREMDLEKKLTESRQVEEDLKGRFQQEVYYMEQEAEVLLVRLFHAENIKEIHLGILKDLREKLTEAERRADNAESESKVLKESNLVLNNKLLRLQINLSTASWKVEQLETQLKSTESQRLKAVASAEASLETQRMLGSTIKDMESQIKDLKLKASRAETQTESAEEKCILLSETNAELTEKINLLTRRAENMEACLHQADEAKQKNVKDIRMQTKLIADLVIKLAFEGARLHKEVLSLRLAKKVSEINAGERIRASPANKTSDEPNFPPTETETDSLLVSEVDTIRDIDARQLNFKNSKQFISVVLLLGILPFLLYLFR